MAVAANAEIDAANRQTATENAKMELKMAKSRDGWIEENSIEVGGLERLSEDERSMIVNAMTSRYDYFEMEIDGSGAYSINLDGKEIELADSSSNLEYIRNHLTSLNLITPVGPIESNYVNGTTIHTQKYMLTDSGVEVGKKLPILFPDDT